MAQDDERSDTTQLEIGWGLAGLFMVDMFTIFCIYSVIFLFCLPHGGIWDSMFVWIWHQEATWVVCKGHF